MTLPKKLQPNIHASDLIIGKCYANLINTDSYFTTKGTYVLLGKCLENENYTYTERNDNTGNMERVENYTSYFSEYPDKPIYQGPYLEEKYFIEIPSCNQETVDILNRELQEHYEQVELNKKANAHAAKLLTKRYQPLVDLIKEKLSSEGTNADVYSSFSYGISTIYIDFKKNGQQRSRIKVDLIQEKVHDISIYHNLSKEVKIVKDAIQEFKEKAAKTTIGPFITEMGRRPPNANTENSGGLLYKLAAKRWDKHLKAGSKTKNRQKSNRKTRRIR